MGDVVDEVVRVPVAVSDEKEEEVAKKLGLETGEVEAFNEIRGTEVSSGDVVALPLGSWGEVATGDIVDICEEDTVEAREYEKISEALGDKDREGEGDAVYSPVLDCI